MSAGHNQYAPMEGVIELRQRIAQKLFASYGLTLDPVSQITVTVGATEAIYSAIQAVVGPGDEPGQNVRRGLEDQFRQPIGLVQLGLGHHFGSEIGHGGGHDHHVGLRGMG